jgi:hypothetical protein
MQNAGNSVLTLARCICPSIFVELLNIAGSFIGDSILRKV